MTREGESPVPAGRQEPVITYSLVADDNGPRDGERTEPRVVKPTRARGPRFDEVAAPLPPDDLVEDIVEDPAPRRRSRASGHERPRSSFARIVVLVGILALLAGGGVLAVTYTGAIKPTVTVIRAPAGGDTTAPPAIDTPDATARLTSSPTEQTTTVVRDAVPAAAATAEPAAEPPLPRARPTMDASAPAAEQPQPAPETTVATPPPAAPAAAPQRTASAPAESPLPKRAPAAEGDVNSLMASVDQILATERAKGGAAAIPSAAAANAPAMDSDTPMDMPAPSLEPAAGPLTDPSAPLAVETLPPAPDAPPGQIVFDANGDPIPPADIPNVDPRYSGW